MASGIIDITDANFEQKILRAQRPVVVAFMAGWNAPSKDMARHLARAAQSHAGQAMIARVDVDASPIISSQYGLTTLPCLLMFHERCIVERRIGALPRQDLDAFIARASALSAPTSAA